MVKKNTILEMQKAEQQRKITLYNLSKVCEENKWTTLAVTSSVATVEELQQAVNQLQQDLIEMDSSVKLVGLENVAQNAQSYIKVTECDAVVLLEKYMKTRYKCLEEILTALENQKTTIAGVIAYTDK